MAADFDYGTPHRLDTPCVRCRAKDLVAQSIVTMTWNDGVTIVDRIIKCTFCGKIISNANRRGLYFGEDSKYIYLEDLVQGMIENVGGKLHCPRLTVGWDYYEYIINTYDRPELLGVPVVVCESFSTGYVSLSAGTFGR